MARIAPARPGLVWRPGRGARACHLRADAITCLRTLPAPTGKFGADFVRAPDFGWPIWRARRASVNNCTLPAPARGTAAGAATKREGSAARARCQPLHIAGELCPLWAVWDTQSDIWISREQAVRSAARGFVWPGRPVACGRVNQALAGRPPRGRRAESHLSDFQIDGPPERGPQAGGRPEARESLLQKCCSIHGRPSGGGQRLASQLALNSSGRRGEAGPASTRGGPPGNWQWGRKGAKI